MYADRIISLQFYSGDYRMNFFNQNSKLQKRKITNRAYEELTKRIHQRLSFSKSEPKQSNTDEKQQAQAYLKNTKSYTDKVIQIKNYRRTNSCLFGSTNKQLKQTIFKQNNNHSNQVQNTTKANGVYFVQSKQLPDSFSSYIIKNKTRLNQKKSRRKFNLHYFDLDQIANQLATPMKLENKIELEESMIQKRKTKLQNFNHFHGFLRDVEIDKPRYNDLPKTKLHHNGVRTEQNNDSKSSYLLKKQISQIDTHSLWRRNLENKGSKGHQNIIPWTENQEDYSPLRPKRSRAITKVMHYGEAELFKVSQ